MQAISRGLRACVGTHNHNIRLITVTAADLVKGGKKEHRGRNEHATVDSDDEWDPRTLLPMIHKQTFLVHFVAILDSSTAFLCPSLPSAAEAVSKMLEHNVGSIAVTRRGRCVYRCNPAPLPLGSRLIRPPPRRAYRLVMPAASLQSNRHRLRARLLTQSTQARKECDLADR